MLIRLGHVLYWAGCLFGALAALLAVGLYVAAPPGTNNLVYSLIIAAIGLGAFLTGLALRYILSGRSA